MDAQALSSVGVHVEGFDYFIVASQTCCIQSGDLTKVPLIEIVGARVIGNADPKMSSGWSPRLLHLEAIKGDGDGVALELRIEERQWIDRRTLARVQQSDFRLHENPNSIGLKAKTVFARWLGTSYTRMEMPNDFNLALQKSKIQKLIGERLSPLKDHIFGIFFALSDPTADDDEPLTPEEMSHLTTPIDLEMTVVVYEEADREKVVAEVDKIFEESMQDPEGKVGEDGKPIKRSRAYLAAHHGVNILGERVDVQTVRAWRTTDLLRTVRYTEIDYLSGTEDDLD